MNSLITWAGREAQYGYECSSLGDKRYSALYATMPDGRSIEQWYQCDIKGYDPGGHNWKLGKGKSPIFAYPNEDLFQMYPHLWKLWAVRNSSALVDLLQAARENNNQLKDSFASKRSPINQAHALSIILNEWIIPALESRQ